MKPMNTMRASQPKILLIAGTRPEIIKIAPLVHALRKSSWAHTVFITSGQHLDILNQQLRIFHLEPEHTLSVMGKGQSLSALTSKLFSMLEKVIAKEHPDAVLSQGDTTTVMVTACVCFYLHIPFIHLEAGLRSHDMQNPFPEEFNRKIVSMATALHLTPTVSAKQALINEGISEEKICVTGNTVIDALYFARDKVPQCPYPYDCKNKLILLTAHRRENLGKPLEDIFHMLKSFVQSRDTIELVYPVHPNPRVQDAAYAILANQDRIHLIPSLNYLEFISMLQNAHLVISDSGGIQEEAPALCKPVLVLRRATERTEAITAGVARLSGTDPACIREDMAMLLDNAALYEAMARGGSPYGDGHAAARAEESIKIFLGISNTRTIPEFSFSAMDNSLTGQAL